MKKLCRILLAYMLHRIDQDVGYMFCLCIGVLQKLRVEALEVV